MNLAKVQTVVYTKISKLLKSNEVISIVKEGKSQPILLDHAATPFPLTIKNLSKVKVTEEKTGSKTQTLIGTYTVNCGSKVLKYIANFKNKSITCIEETFDANNNIVKKMTAKMRNIKIRNEIPSSHIFDRFANFYNNCEQYFVTKFKDGKPLNVFTVVREQSAKDKTESIKLKHILKNGKRTPYGLKLKQDAAVPVCAIDISVLNDGKEETLTNIKTLLSDKRVARAAYKRGFTPQFDILNESAETFQSGIKNLWQTKEVYSLPLTDLKADLLSQRLSVESGSRITSFVKSFMNKSQKIIEVKRGKNGGVIEKTVSYLSHSARPKHKSPSSEHLIELNKLKEKVRLKIITKFKNNKPLITAIEATDKNGVKIRFPWNDEYKHQFRAIGQ